MDKSVGGVVPTTVTAQDTAPTSSMYVCSTATTMSHKTSGS